MAVAVVLELPNTTVEQYDRLVETVLGPGAKISPPELFHVAGPTDTGIRIITVWESEQAFQRFTQEKILPAAQQVGLGGQPKISMWNVHRLMTPQGSLL